MSQETRQISLKRVVRAVTPRTMRNWLRSPARSAEWILDGLQFACGVSRDLEIAPGWHLKCHPRAYRVFLRDQVIDEVQRAEFRNFLRYCEGGMRLFDIGVHFGVFSLAAVHAGGQAVAVDVPADLEFHNEMVTNDGGDPQAAPAELERLGYAAFDFNGGRLEPGDLAAQPLARFVARRESSS